MLSAKKHEVRERFAKYFFYSRRMAVPGKRNFDHQPSDSRSSRCYTKLAPTFATSYPTFSCAYCIQRTHNDIIIKYHKMTFSVLKTIPRKSFSSLGLTSECFSISPNDYSQVTSGLPRSLKPGVALLPQDGRYDIRLYCPHAEEWKVACEKSLSAHCFKFFHGMFIIESSLNHPGIIIESSLKHHWVIIESSLNHHWIIIESSLNHHRTNIESLNHNRIIIESSLKHH